MAKSAAADVVEVHESVRKVGDHVWVERGPAIVEAIATAETLSDAVTAPHYHLPKTVQMPSGPQEIVARDAYGKEIRAGRRFSFVDWLKPSNERPWYVYQKGHREVYDHNPDGTVKMGKDGQPQTKLEDYWHEVAVCPTEQEALDLAKSLPQEYSADARMNARGEVGRGVKALHSAKLPE